MAPPAGARATAKCRPRGIRTSSADTAARTQLRRQPRPPPPGPPAPPPAWPTVPARPHSHSRTAPRLAPPASGMFLRVCAPLPAPRHSETSASPARCRLSRPRGRFPRARPAPPGCSRPSGRDSCAASPGPRGPPSHPPAQPCGGRPPPRRPPGAGLRPRATLPILPGKLPGTPARGPPVAPRWPTPCPPPCPATPGPAPSRATELPGPLREQQRDRTQADRAVGGRAGRGAQPRRPALEDRGLGRLPQARLLEDVAFATALAGRGHRPGTRGRTAAPLSLPGQGGNGGASRHRHGAPLPPQRTLGRSVTCPPSRSTHGPIRTDRGTTEHVPREDQSQLAKEGES